MGGSTAQLSELREGLRQAEERVIQTGQDLERIEVVRNEIADLMTSQVRQIDRLTAIADRGDTLRGASIRDHLAEAIGLSQRVVEVFGEVQANLSNTGLAILEENIAAREQASPIRDELERAESGLGQITAQLRNVDAALRSLDENDAIISELEARQTSLAQQRTTRLDTAERAEEILYETRAEVARSTTSQIANNVVVVVDHLADASEFRANLQEALRGTSTRLALIGAVADRVLPRQLMEMIEDRDASGLAAVTEIAVDRAQKLIENLDTRETLQGLAQIQLTDSVDFRLTDGSVEKSVDELSTGQKCAVTLPIVLSERERTLILDQPEDHLDNAFLVTNVISGLISRGQNGAQTIVATHNANIPVLGSADTVIVLTSDGRVGSVDVRGSFDADDVVDRITRLMEGGRDAFARRSAFYAEHGGI